MKDPIKIIHKFKNNNNKIQYKIYIFIGPLVPENILDILNSFSNKDLFTTFTILSKKAYNNLENYFGEYWYQYFFISYHIQNQRQNIHNTIHKKNN